MEQTGKIIKKLKDLTRHEYISLVNCCNAAIFASVYIAKKINPKPFVLVPEQGGWISFKTYPKILGFEVMEVKTDRGVIDLDDLKSKAKTASAFLVTSFAGYYAEQPVREISEICKNSDCLLIEDATGAIGDKKLCNGANSDIIVGSFGRWKPVNYGKGGFIAVSNKEYFDKTEEIYSMMKFNPDYGKLLKKINKARQRLAFFIRKCQKIKKDLKKQGIDAFHKEKRGINVVAGFRNSAEKEKIVKYCRKNEYEFVVCPKEIRVDEDAISIEVKRL